MSTITQCALCAAHSRVWFHVCLLHIQSAPVYGEFFSFSAQLICFYPYAYRTIFFFCHCYWFKACSISHLLVSYYCFFFFTNCRLRQESEILSRSSSQHWSQSDLQSYASTTNITTDDEAAHTTPSTENLSSTETLKWLGSMSDISLSSHVTNSSHISTAGNYYRHIKINSASTVECTHAHSVHAHAHVAYSYHHINISTFIDIFFCFVDAFKYVFVCPVSRLCGVCFVHTLLNATFMVCLCAISTNIISSLLFVWRMVFCCCCCTWNTNGEKHTF